MSLLQRIKSLNDSPREAEHLSAKQLKEIVETSNEAYYQGEPLLTDVSYDIITEIFTKKDPKAAKKLFSHNSSYQRTKLPFWMGSLDKFRTQKELLRWTKKHNGPYIRQVKLDGLAFLYYQGKLYTRGDGSHGVDISHILKNVNFFKVEPDYPIVGEMIISKKDFKSISKTQKYSSARALVAGAIHASNPDRTILKKIQLVAFSIPDSQSKPSEQLTQLKELGCTIPENSIVDTIEFEELKQLLTDLRKSSKFEIDGIVVSSDKYHPRNTSGNPKYAFAFKCLLIDQMAETTVTEVQWNISRRKEFIPRVSFEPVKINGINIQNATGHNEEFITNNGIGVGAKIIVTRSGDVIPYIYQVTKKAKVVSKKPTQKNSKAIKNAVRLKQHVHFIESLGVKGVKAATLKKISAESMSLLELLELDCSNWEIVGKEAGPKAYHAINKKLKNIPLITLLVASSCFEAGIGTQILKNVFKELPNLIKLRSNLTEKLLEIPGIKDATAEKIVRGLESFKEWYSEHKSVLTILKEEQPLKKAKKLKLSGKIFAFSGFRDKLLEQWIIENGGTISSSVTRSTTDLIVKDKNSTSSNIKKAVKNGVQITVHDEFKQD